MELQLQNPIAFFDLETTGLNISKDRIVEIAILKINIDGTEHKKTMRINPEMPIPKESSDVHGITDEDVKDKPTFREVAKDIAQFIDGCDLGGYNSNRFDIPLLAEEFLRADVDTNMRKRRFVDVQTIFHKMEQRTLSAAYKFYCEKDLVGAHGADADTMATYEILKSQLDKYPDLKNDIKSLSDFTTQIKTADFAGFLAYDKEGVEIFNFGKNKGVAVTKVLTDQPGYYSWIMNSDFPLYTKKVLTEIKLRLGLK